MMGQSSTVFYVIILNVTVTSMPWIIRGLFKGDWIAWLSGNDSVNKQNDGEKLILEGNRKLGTASKMRKAASANYVNMNAVTSRLFS